MPTTNPVVSSLPAYVQTNRDMILKNFALVGTDTRKRISIQTGVKKNAYLNYLDIAPTLGDGSACGFSAAGTATITQRTIATAAIKVNMDLCDKLLLGKYAEYLVRLNATEEEFPFEQYFMEGLVSEINKKIEKLIWQGDTSQSSDADIKWIDGFLELMDDDTSYLADDINITSGASAYAGLLQVYAAMPEETLNRGGVIFVAPAIYRAFMQDMVAMNYYHYSPGNDFSEEFPLPGTDVMVIKTPGLAGSLAVVGTFAANLVYGCDMQGDEEDIKVWFSDDDDVWKVKALWNSGVQYHFPGQIVRGTFAASPSPTTPVASGIAALSALAGAYDSEDKLINVKDNA